MPYANKEDQRACIKRWKDAHRDQIRAEGRAYWRSRHIPKVHSLISIQDRKKKKADKDRRYREKHSDLLRRRKADYYQREKKKSTEKAMNRWRTDIRVRLASNLRSRIGSAIRKQCKVGSAVGDLGCSIESFKEYISSKFQHGMSWENWGEWHLDHVVPLISFDLTDREQFLKACHFTNYQPLWAVDNLRKGGRR